jgi:methionine aminotransferase
MRPPDYRIDWADVRRRLSPRTRLAILNSPHNPSGTVLERGDLLELSNLLDGTGVLVLSDEVYEHIIFDGLRHESVARYSALQPRSFIVGSFGKTYHTTGWKIGYCLAPPALSGELRRVHQYVTFATNTPIQHALADFVRERRGYPDLPAFYQEKRDRFLALMAGSRFRPIACRGTYFQLMDYSAISDEDDMSLALRLTREHGVASIPTSPFLYESQAPRVLRFCFAKKNETLERAAESLRRI